MFAQMQRQSVRQDSQKWRHSRNREIVLFLDTDCVVKYTDPETFECLSIGRMSPILEIKMSLIWRTFS